MRYRCEKSFTEVCKGVLKRKIVQDMVEDSLSVKDDRLIENGRYCRTIGGTAMLCA